MKILVTGCAGFIGSHLVDALLAGGDEVVGVDCMTPYYGREIKDRNTSRGMEWRCYEDDIAHGIIPLLEDVDVVVHLAAQPGVRFSFKSFETYAQHNMVATQKLLEDMHTEGVPALVFASSSSVYGQSTGAPMVETDPLQPISPYGVTKVGTENLVRVYCEEGLRAIGLRYFTVFGPRQRPDMAFSRFLRDIDHGSSIDLYGKGQMFRDYTYVQDAVAATLSAIHLATEEDPTYGLDVFNIGGGNFASGNQVVEAIAEVTGLTPQVRLVKHTPSGDVQYTRADIGKARRVLGFDPQVNLKDGLARQWEWYKSV